MEASTSRGSSFFCAFGIVIFLGLLDFGNSSKIYYVNPVQIPDHRTFLYVIPDDITPDMTHGKLPAIPYGAIFLSKFDNKGKFSEQLNEKYVGTAALPDAKSVAILPDAKSPIVAFSKNMFRALSAKENSEPIPTSTDDESKSSEEPESTPVPETVPYLEMFINTVKRQTEHLMEPKSASNEIAAALSIKNSEEPLANNEADAKLPEVDTATQAPLPLSVPCWTRHNRPETAQLELITTEDLTDDKELTIPPTVSIIPEVPEQPNETELVSQNEVILPVEEVVAEQPKNLVMNNSEEASLEQYEEIKKISVDPEPSTPLPSTIPETPETPPSATPIFSTTLETSDDTLPTTESTTTTSTESTLVENITESENVGLVPYKLPPVTDTQEVTPELTPAPILLPSALVPPPAKEQPEFVEIMRQNGQTMILPQQEMPQMTNTWLKDVALKSLDGNAKYQQVIAINIGNVAINLSNGNGTEVVSFWKELFPSSRFFQDVKTIDETKGTVQISSQNTEAGVYGKRLVKESAWNKLGEMVGMSLFAPNTPPTTISGQTGTSQSDSSSPGLEVAIDPRSIELSTVRPIPLRLRKRRRHQ